MQTLKRVDSSLHLLNVIWIIKMIANYVFVYYLIFTSKDVYWSTVSVQTM